MARHKNAEKREKGDSGQAGSEAACPVHCSEKKESEAARRDVGQGICRTYRHQDRRCYQEVMEMGYMPTINQPVDTDAAPAHCGHVRSKAGVVLC